MIYSSSVYNPPDIEKILDTTITKDNKRYYKVKWVKTSWEAESDLIYFRNIIDDFWSEFTRGILQSQPNEESIKIPGSTEDFERLFTDTDDISTPVTSGASEISHPSVIHLNENAAITENEDAIEGVHSDIPAIAEALSSAEGSLHLQETVIDMEKEKGKNPLQDEFCGNAMFGASNQSDSIIDDGQSELFNCDKCCKTFKKESSYVKHTRSHASRKCPMCDKEFGRIAHLETHILTHTNVRPWLCKQCGKTFTDKSSLKKHELVHSGIRNFSCTLCEESFQRAQHLRRHVEAKHDQVRNFICDVCGKSFHQKSTLKTHLNVHSGDKPHQCRTCGKSFADKSTLSRHLFTHSSIKQYKCSVCSRSFSRKRYLVQHQEKSHLGGNKSCSESEKTGEKRFFTELKNTQTSKKEQSKES